MRWTSIGAAAPTDCAWVEARGVAALGESARRHVCDDVSGAHSNMCIRRGQIVSLLAVGHVCRQLGKQAGLAALHCSSVACVEAADASYLSRVAHCSLERAALKDARPFHTRTRCTASAAAPGHLPRARRAQRRQGRRAAPATFSSRDSLIGFTSAVRALRGEESWSATVHRASMRRRAQRWAWNGL